MDKDIRLYLLGVVVIALLAIVIPQWFSMRSYSDLDAYKVCQKLYSDFSSLPATKQNQDAWIAFETTANSELETIVADLEAHMDAKSPASTSIYQLAKYEFPQAIKSRNKKGGKQIEESLVNIAQLIEAPHMTTVNVARKPETSKEGETWDPVITGVIAFDGMLLMLGLAFMFFRWSKPA